MDSPQSDRRRRLVAAAVLPGGILIAAAVVLLWPDADPGADSSGGYGVEATVRVVPGGGAGTVSSATLERSAKIIGARAKGLGLAGVRVTTSGDDRLTVRIGRAVGWEQVLRVTWSPQMWVEDIQGNVVVAPGRISGFGFSGGRFHLSLPRPDRRALTDALARGRGLRVQSRSDAGLVNLGAPVRSSAALRNEIDVVPLRRIVRSGAADHLGRVLAGGGADVRFRVDEVRDVGAAPPGTVTPPRWALEALETNIALRGASPPRWRTLRARMDVVVEGRRVQAWDGADVTGATVAAVLVDDHIPSAATCPRPGGPAQPTRACLVSIDSLAEPFTLVYGTVGPRSATVEIRASGRAFPATVVGRRFAAVISQTDRFVVVGASPTGRVVARAPFPPPR